MTHCCTCLRSEPRSCGLLMTVSKKLLVSSA
uniref:Uncharacterized protein n=1 Tax=Anguilla anguilla TaxID=7936 RepID=A0A0E9VGB6_ANGAN